jgi:hypothetical protein
MQAQVGAAGAGWPVPARSVAAVPGRTRWVRIGRELAVVALLYLGYSLSRLLVDTGPAGALANGYALLAWEQRFGLDVEHAIVHWVLEVPALSIAAGYLYATLHYTVTPGVLVWLYRSHPAHYLRSRRILAAATVAALVGYWLYPTAPPRLLTSGVFPDVLALFADWGWWGADASAPQGLGALTNEYAAMPSMHVGWAVWSGVAIAVLARRPVVRLLGLAYPLVITLVVVATANHYLVDAFAGAAVVGAVAAGAHVMAQARRRGEGSVLELPAQRSDEDQPDSAAPKKATSRCMARR